jgi:hypothetical protein
LTIRQDGVEVINSPTSKLMKEDYQEVEKVQIVSIKEELNESDDPIILISKQKKSKSTLKSHPESKDPNEHK